MKLMKIPKVDTYNYSVHQSDTTETETWTKSRRCDRFNIMQSDHTQHDCTTHQASHSSTDKKKSRTYPGLYRTPIKNFPGPFRSPQMFKYKEKKAFTYDIQNVVHCRKFSIKQNVDVSCSEFRWTYLHTISYMQWL